MTINTTQRNLDLQVGQCLNREPENTVAGFIKADSVNTFEPAVAIKIVGNEKGAMIFEKALATDKFIYFVAYEAGRTVYGVTNLRDRALAAIGEGGEMYMRAGGVVVAGQALEIVPASNKVIVNAGTNTVVGIALTNANADGDIIKVKIRQI